MSQISRLGSTNHIVPGASTALVRALVAGKDVDEDAGVSVVVDGTLAVATPADTGEGNGLTSERALVRSTSQESVARASLDGSARLCSGNE